MLHLKGYPVRVFLVGNPDKGTEEFRTQLKIAGNVGLFTLPWQEGEKEECGLLIDAVFGVGLSRPVEGDYMQCIESTIADGYEMFLLDFSRENYFRANVERLDLESGKRFFKLAGIHHTIRVVRRRKKQLDWEEMSAAMARVYELDEKERQMADILYRCASLYQSGFADLFARTTARYLFHTIEMTPQTLAFLLNFWYNSYSSFMASFVGYVPFHIRLQKASGS